MDLGGWRDALASIILCTVPFRKAYGAGVSVQMLLELILIGFVRFSARMVWKFDAIDQTDGLHEIRIPRYLGSLDEENARTGRRVRTAAR